MTGGGVPGPVFRAVARSRPGRARAAKRPVPFHQSSYSNARARMRFELAGQDIGPRVFWVMLVILALYIKYNGPP